MNFFSGKSKNLEEAKEKAVKELLKYNLKYTEKELDNLQINGTKLAPSGDIIYMALEEHEDVREIFIRKAECKNERMEIRNYIPPGFYERYTTLSRMCTESRREDPDLKTQICFNKKDVEVLTKRRGSGEQFQTVKLDEMFDMEKVPEFDYEIKWRGRPDRQERRRMTSSPTREMPPHWRRRSTSKEVQRKETETAEGRMIHENPTTGKEKVTRPVAWQTSGEKQPKMNGWKTPTEKSVVVKPANRKVRKIKPADKTSTTNSLVRQHSIKDADTGIKKVKTDEVEDCEMGDEDLEVDDEYLQDKQNE